MSPGFMDERGPVSEEATGPTGHAFLREPAERVLPTLNRDGTRRWLRPRLSPGRFHGRRRVLAWALIALFTAIPYIRMNGKPLVLLDVVRREFTLFGTTFVPTDTMLLMLFLVGTFLGIFWLTAVYGRVWCGWACPQTVYMEFVYRPLERLIEGSRAAQEGLDRRWVSLRRVVKYAVFVVVSMFLAHTFLAYFVGVESLARWVTRSPVEHPVAFLVMAGATLLMLLDFGFFREQVCMVACPYGRFQSVLLDRRSLIVGYDPGRGEPRGTYRARRAAAGDGAATRTHGDCIDCGACVVTCPTGIDIRDGLQMECVHCTQCIDACDAVMDHIGRPRGLIRYTSRDELQGAPRRILRARVVAYPLLLLAVFGGLGWALAHRPLAEVTILRGVGSPFVLLSSGEISNQIRIRIANRDRRDHEYRMALVDGGGLRLIAPDNPLRVRAGKTATTTAFVAGQPRAISGGARDIRLRVDDGQGFGVEVPYRVLGPRDEDPGARRHRGAGQGRAGETPGD
ncbi:MAG TPA: cytochrome c oxidase accessory protein CcoG [Candidatus Binatia bacterium]|nr:cytochrome c oxidase accessory protein CcoG [Candidatus Binatia bacterium]